MKQVKQEKLKRKIKAQKKQLSFRANLKYYLTIASLIVGILVGLGALYECFLKNKIEITMKFL